MLLFHLVSFIVTLIMYGMLDSVISDLQHIQNTSARILHWLPIKQRIVYTIPIATYKAYHSIAPKYMCDLFTRREHMRELGTNDQRNLYPW